MSEKLEQPDYVPETSKDYRGFIPIAEAHTPMGDRILEILEQFPELHSTNLKTLDKEAFEALQERLVVAFKPFAGVNINTGILADTFHRIESTWKWERGELTEES